MILAKQNRGAVNIESIISSYLERGELKELLLVVPTNRKLRDYKKEIISAFKGKGVTGLNLETFESLCSKILEVSTIFVNLEEAPSAVLLSHAVSETELNYFSSYKGEIPNGTLNRIRSVISEYKRNGITPDVLRGEAEKLPHSEKLKALDIASIYENYLLKTISLAAFEAGDVYSALNGLTDEDFEEHFKKVFPDAKEILIKGFDEFTGPEAGIVDRLAKIKSLSLLLQFDYYAGNSGLFAHLDKTYDKFEKRGFVKIKENESGNNSRFKKIIREQLFSEYRGKRINEFKESLFKFDSFTREEEIVNIAKEVKRLILEENAEPYKICVAFNLVQNYSPVLNEVFSVYGIPLNLTDRVYLEYTAPIIAILNLLEILENDYYFKNVIRAFSSNVLAGKGIELKSILKSAIELKIIGGRENWIAMLKNAVDERKKYKNADEQEDSEIKTFTSALESIQAIHSILKPFEGKLTIGEFLEKFELMVYELNIPFHILELSAEKEKEIKAVTTFLETLKEVFNLLAVQCGDAKKFPISFFLDQMRTSASHARFNVKEKSDSAVLVTNLEEIRGLEFDYLFIGGLCDGDLPTRYQPEIFYSGTFQKQEETHLIEERYRFYQSLCAFNKRLYLSAPLNESNRELNESSFLKEFTRLFDVSLLPQSYFASKVYSNEEIQKLIGTVAAKVKDELLIPELEGEEFDKDYFYKASEVQKIRSAGEDSLSPYTGYVDLNNSDIAAPVKELIEEKFGVLKNKQYSISQLETYAKCPFKFFAERVLNIKPEEEPSEEIEAVEMGNLLHSVFYKFFTFLRNNGIELNDCTEEQFAAAKVKLFEIAENEINEMPFSSPLNFFEKEKILGIKGDKANSILFKLLMHEKENKDGYQPKFFETPFGFVEKEGIDESIKDTSSIEMEGVKLKGKIDRIEIDDKNKLLRIVDYKLNGKKPTNEELWTGISLQLPVYLAAAEQILFNNYSEKLVPAEMVIYSLKFSEGDFGPDKVNLKSKKDDDEAALTGELIKQARLFIAKYVSEISEGKFNLSQNPKRDSIVCCYCGLKPICRVSESK